MLHEAIFLATCLATNVARQVARKISRVTPPATATWPLGDFKSGIYLFNWAAKINFGNASLFPVICSEYFYLTAVEVIFNAEDRFLKISVHFQI